MTGVKDTLGDDLFPGWENPATPHYPRTPGSKGGETSRLAAQRIAPSVTALRRSVVEELRRQPDQTADEIAGRLGISFLSIRPRCSELRANGVIAPSGRGLSSTGSPANKWRLVAAHGGGAP